MAAFWCRRKDTSYTGGRSEFWPQCSLCYSFCLSGYNIFSISETRSRDGRGLKDLAVESPVFEFQLVTCLSHGRKIQQNQWVVVAVANLFSLRSICSIHLLERNSLKMRFVYNRAKLSNGTPEAWAKGCVLRSLPWCWKAYKRKQAWLIVTKSALVHQFLYGISSPFPTHIND